MRSDNYTIDFVPERLSSLETVGAKMRQYNQKASGVGKWLFPMLAILIIFLLILAGNFLSSKDSGSEKEELPIPEEIKEQGTSGLTKLNPDPEVKEGW